MSTGTDGAPSYKRKLIEVALPLEDINREAAREKSIRHGHPSTLHLWWARRPLAAARAVLFGQLVDDPSANPDRFPTSEAQHAERERLFTIIRDLVKWENSTNENVLAAARKEIWDSCDGNPPPILDPFAGGGSIPLEAQRLGLVAHASDLNPVAVLINKALIEIPPKFSGNPPVHPEAKSQLRWRGAEGLAEDVRCYGKWMRDEAERRIGHLYPKAKLDDGTLAKVIAWIWARTVTCPNPACSGTMPLVRSFWLGKKKGNERYAHAVSEGGRVRFDIRGPQGTPRNGTVSRKGAECLLCGAAVPLAYIRAEGKARRLGAQLVAVVAEGTRIRHYLPRNDEHELASYVPQPDDELEEELAIDPRNLWCVNYGLTRFSDLFTSRQLTALTTFTSLTKEVKVQAEEHAAAAGFNAMESADYGTAVATYLSFALSRVADRNSTLCTWDSGPTGTRSSTGGSARTASVRNAFARQALPMTWDYAEASPFGSSGGSFDSAMNWLIPAIALLPSQVNGTACQVNAAAPGAMEAGSVVATDPPYYDNISYGNLSDFFYVWLRRSLVDVYPELMGTVLTPKADELIADPARHKDAKHFFEDGFRSVFREIRKGSPEDYPITLFYAFKQAESGDHGESSTGWETLLDGMIGMDWMVTGTWPLRTELGNRMRSLRSNALASSIVLACRPRKVDAGTTDRRGFLALMREELPGRLKELQQGNIAPVDLAQYYSSGLLSAA